MSLYRVSLQGTLLGQEAVNVWYYEPGGVPVGSVEQFCDDWDTVVKPLYQDCVSQHYTFQSIRAVDIATQVVAEKAITGVGTRLGACSAPQNCAVVSWKTGLASRHGRGRTYVPGLAVIDTTDGQVGATLRNNLDLWQATARYIIAGPHEYSLVIYQRAHNLWNTVTSGIVRSIVYSQRRRTLGVGA